MCSAASGSVARFAARALRTSSVKPRTVVSGERRSWATTPANVASSASRSRSSVMSYEEPTAPSTSARPVAQRTGVHDDALPLAVAQREHRLGAVDHLAAGGPHQRGVVVGIGRPSGWLMCSEGRTSAMVLASAEIAARALRLACTITPSASQVTTVVPSVSRICVR